MFGALRRCIKVDYLRQKSLQRLTHPTKIYFTNSMSMFGALRRWIKVDCLRQKSLQRLTHPTKIYYKNILSLILCYI